MAVEGRKNQIVIVGVAIAAAVVAAAVAGWLVAGMPSGSTRTMDELRALPLVSTLMADDPAVATRLRAALEEEQRNPTLQGPTRPFLVIAELRKTHIGPALSAADDASAIAVMTARAELVRHLQKTDLPACRQFSGNGIQRVDKLDAEGARLFRNLLTAMEAAYRSGRAPDAKPQPAASDQDFAAMLMEGGITQADLQKLADILKLADAELCELELRVDLTPTILAAEKRGAFARFILTH